MTGKTPISSHAFAVVGGSRFLRSEALHRLLASIGGDASGDVGPSRFDGERAALADVLDEARTVSLFGERRVVLVDDADAFIQANRAALERYCSAPTGEGMLILLCDSLPRNTKLCKILADRNAVVACEAPRNRAVVDWIMGRARERYGKQMTPAAAQSLRDHAGDEPGQLDGEIAKLSAFVDTRVQITPQDVLALTGSNREENVFAVTDALGAGDAARALNRWEQVLATDRAAPGRAIAGLAWGVRQLIDARRDCDAGAGFAEVAGRLRMDPTTARRRLERFSTRDLEEQQRDLLLADVALKTGATTLEVAVERFIVKHCRAAG